METKIIKTIKAENYTIIEAACGKVSAFVVFDKYGVQVCCQNASNRTWKGLGRRFATVDEALGGYKSAAMKAIISAARTIASESTPENAEKKAEWLGRRAHIMGADRVPGLDRELSNLIDRRDGVAATETLTETSTDSVPLMKAWLRGWDNGMIEGMMALRN